MTEWKPASEAQLALALAECAGAGRTIRFGGHFTKDALAGPVQADATVSTCAMRRVVKYEPRDLTISVEAGMPWVELTDVLAANRQMVPLDPPWFDRCTVGGVVAANMSGPRRRLYGTARDLVIGIRFATLEGAVVQSGGMVVKNVAGLDMSKLMIGSWGTLAAIAVVNFKLAPMPLETRTFALEFDDASAAFDRRDQILQSVLQPAAIDVVNPAAAELLGLGGQWTMLLQAGGTAAVLDRYARELPDARVLDCTVWSDVREFVPRTGARRVITTLTGLRDVMPAGTGPALSRAGSGVAYISINPPPQPMASEMIGKVKQLFDPKGLLNPGRLYDGF